MKKTRKISLMVVFASVLSLSFILPAYNTVNAAGAWVMKQGVMTTRRGFGMASKIYALGGRSVTQVFSVVEVYDPDPKSLVCGAGNLSA
ncbi:MAG: hypothetical protein K6U80_09725 [Firmicutes bacterium]|nr:hypothetical protein [Bacillota bacterium]